MNPLKYVLTFAFSVFLTIGLFASQNSEQVFQSQDKISIENIAQVSAADAISLFNFFKIETVEPNPTNTKTKLGESRLEEFFDFFKSVSATIK